ncbi:sulfurtransferase [Novosphingobium sp. 9U]|uniref:sulfurtransferase n=1 Tax=Novosphingobium sp. 9U TaxID=2653158 RepID=UPI0012EF6F47|nr:sulfurtransferase [Novosphingobium sp. 9U]VWX53439.1 putative 3-mercaptopyruvate sulfurtransferase [Novosphingobium sp. 9U]
MTYETIAQVQDLRELLADGADVLVLDCEFDLGDPDRGRAVYLEAHLPGARYVDLELDLSGEVTGDNGRHPLPARTAFAATMRALGLKAGQQVVAYDGNGGIYAARLWWMLRWLGHPPVAVLDGGRQAWAEAALPFESGEPGPVREGDFTLGEPLVGQPVTAREVLANIAAGELQVIDARDAQRFAGAPHPLDTVSGHIPGASNRFYRDNFDEGGRLKPAADLAQAFATALGGKAPGNAVLQCGSGVTACHNLLAMEIAGLKGGRLYPGSWSEWTSDPLRPVER